MSNGRPFSPPELLHLPPCAAGVGENAIGAPERHLGSPNFFTCRTRRQGSPGKGSRPALATQTASPARQAGRGRPQCESVFPLSGPSCFTCHTRRQGSATGLLMKRIIVVLAVLTVAGPVSAAEVLPSADQRL